MAEDTDTGEKTEAPSQYRIEEFRKKGQVASSKEVNSLIILAATIMTITIFSVYAYEVLTDFIYWLVNLQAKEAYKPEFYQLLIKNMALTGIKCSAPVFISTILISFLSQVSQIGFIYAPDVLQLKFDRINPINGFQRLFSTRALVEALKGLFKFSIILSIVYFTIKDNMGSFTGFLHVELPASMAFGKMLALKLAYSIIIGLVVVAIGDFAWEKYSYMQKLKMTKQQVKEEQKDKDGNPEIKQKIRSIQREMSRKRMMNDVPKADAIITNPTHLSVAVKYDPATMIAPEVIAKGADQVALKIREIAKENDILIVENVPLARTLYKTVKIGEGVPRSLYKAVAEVLAFVYKKRKKRQNPGLRG